VQLERNYLQAAICLVQCIANEEDLSIPNNRPKWLQINNKSRYDLQLPDQHHYDMKFFG
jgi:hypothetical protein